MLLIVRISCFDGTVLCVQCVCVCCIYVVVISLVVVYVSLTRFAVLAVFLVVNVLSIWLSACSLHVALPLSLSLSLHIIPAHVHAMDCYSNYNGERVRVVVY